MSTYEMTRPWKTALLVIANLLIPAAVLIFAAGFFPYKPFLSGLAEHDVSQYGELPPAQFDGVILMVVDALRRYTRHVHRSSEVG